MPIDPGFTLDDEEKRLSENLQRALDEHELAGNVFTGLSDGLPPKPPVASLVDTIETRHAPSAVLKFAIEEMESFIRFRVDRAKNKNTDPGD